MRFFFNADLLDNGFHGCLDATSFQRPINQSRIFQSSFTVWENEMGVSVKVPEFSQNAQCVFRQRNQPVFVALGVTDMNPHVGGVYISHCQLYTFAKAQSHAVDCEEEDLITQPVGCDNELLYLIDGQNIRNPGCLWRLDQGDVMPGFIQHTGVEEFQAVQIEFDRAPGMRLQEFVEIVK
jgi:hypothetical protein